MCVIRCATFQRNSQVSKLSCALGEVILRRCVIVPTQAGAGGGFSPSRARSEAFGGELPGLADGSHSELEKGALPAQGNARRPRSCLRPGFTSL